MGQNSFFLDAIDLEALKSHADAHHNNYFSNSGITSKLPSYIIF